MGGGSFVLFGFFTLCAFLSDPTLVTQLTRQFFLFGLLVCQPVG